MKYSTVAILTSDDKSWSGYNSCNYKYSVITHCAALHLLRANEQVRDFLKMLRSAHIKIRLMVPARLVLMVMILSSVALGKFSVCRIILCTCSSVAKGLHYFV